MFRLIFVALVFLVGAFFAAQSAFYSLLLYLWVAYFRPELWVWNDIILKLNLSYVVGIWTVLITLFAGNRLRFDFRVGVLVLVLLQSTLSVIFGIRNDFAWGYWTEFVKALLITYLIVVQVTNVARFRLVLVVIGLSLGFEAAKQGWAQLVLNPGAQNINSLALFGDNNVVGVGMLMLIPILTTLGATATGRWERRMYQFLALGVVYRAISTYSRGAFLGAAVLGLYYILRSHRRVAALVGISLAVILIAPVLPDVFWERMATIKTASSAVAANAAEEQPEVNDEVESMDGSSASRLHFWGIAIDMANDRPLFGVGHNSYQFAYDRYDTMGGHFGRRRSVHSAWFGILAELGYPGFLMFLTTLTLSFLACRRARRAVKLGAGPPELARFAFAIEASLIAFMLGGSFVPFQYNEMLWHTIGLSIALNWLASEALATAPAVAVVAAPAAPVASVAGAALWPGV